MLQPKTKCSRSHLFDFLHKLTKSSDSNLTSSDRQYGSHIKLYHPVPASGLGLHYGLGLWRSDKNRPALLEPCYLGWMRSGGPKQIRLPVSKSHAGEESLQWHIKSPLTRTTLRVWSAIENACPHITLRKTYRNLWAPSGRNIPTPQHGNLLASWCATSDISQTPI